MANLQLWRLIRALQPCRDLPKALGETPPSLDNGATSLEAVCDDTYYGSQGFVLIYVTEESPIKDKAFRRYAAGVEKALSLFETALEEWADYISFLNRVLKVWHIPTHCSM